MKKEKRRTQRGAAPPHPPGWELHCRRFFTGKLGPPAGVLFAVVDLQQNLLELGDQRIARIRAGALVVERLEGEFVELREEGRLVDAVLLDALRNFELGLQLLDRGDQLFDLLVVLPPKPQ